MPTSAPYCVPIIANVARQLQPKSVLDVGVGFGKYGYVFREYLDIWNGQSLRDYSRDRWTTRIEGIEVTPEYITPLHDYIYDKIHLGDASAVIDDLGQFDVIVMCDVLEHFDKAAGEALLDKLYDHAEQCVLLAFPPDCDPHGEVMGNPYLAHRSRWNRSDFKRFDCVEYRVVEDRAAIVAITRPDCTPPMLTACFGARRRTGWKGVASRSLVNVLGAGVASKLVSRFSGQTVALRA